MDVGERFKAFTIHTVKCRGGYIYTSKILVGFMKISQVSLVVAGGGVVVRGSLIIYAPGRLPQGYCPFLISSVLFLG